MQIVKISDTEETISFDFTCPFCSKTYTITKTWKLIKGGSTCLYDFPDEDNYCQHLIMWDNSVGGTEYSEAISELEWLTRMSDLPFRVWDVLQEIVNNDELPEGCEAKLRAFYFCSYIFFVFSNNPEKLADVVREKTKEYICQYQ